MAAEFAAFQDPKALGIFLQGPGGAGRNTLAAGEAFFKIDKGFFCCFIQGDGPSLQTSRLMAVTLEIF
jgi:hypothetical protein